MSKADKNTAEEQETTTDKEKKMSDITPAMEQYLEIKRQHMEYLLFFRMGDFYELFFEDAITASGALGLALTSRSKNSEKNIPMCGVPFHACDMYLERLIKMGYKVAICEQMEDPREAKKRGAKSVVKREVVRLVTPGTVTEDELLDAKRNNYIAAVTYSPKELGLAWTDISTGAFFTQLLSIEKIPAEVMLAEALARISPVELIIEDRLLEIPEFYSLLNDYREKLSPRARALFNFDSAVNILHKAYKVQTTESFGDFSKPELIAAGVLVSYVENTQKGKLPRLLHPKRINNNEIMEIDAATRRGLEILNPVMPSGVCLIKVLDKTVTSLGGRLFTERLACPTTNLHKINDRLDAVSFFYDNPDVRQAMRKTLRGLPDMERAIQRLSVGRGGPKDLYDLAETLHAVPAVQEIVLSFQNYQKDSIYTQAPQALYKLAKEFYDHSALENDIKHMLLEDRNALPTYAKDGNFVKEGAHPPLDYLRNIRNESENKCAALREKYEAETGISAIKIKNNSVIGYFVEVPARFADKMLENKNFIHRQTVLNAVRFTTQELSMLESEVNSSLEKALQIELQIFDELMNYALAHADMISNTARRIAELDVASALAELAAEHGFARPIVDESLDFEVIDGRHPVVESVMKDEGRGAFIGNTCILNHENDRIWLLTGPNMAGKSTFMRQNALIVIMAQAGSFVPAKSAKIGIVNKMFSRVGASDDLAHGRSTFMVEMVETASILNRADERSFVILDEIGRGTATFDGLSIAWAVVEQLAEVNKCRTIFATHYHELTKLNNRLKGLTLHCIRIKEFNGDVVFMHEVIEGAADRSYGIHVAKLAGLPTLTVKRAEQVLKLLEEEKHHKALTAVEDELPLFEVLREKEHESEKTENPVLAELRNLDVDSLSPREALDKLYTLKNKAEKN